MNIFRKIYKNLVVIGKPLVVHTEALAIDSVWEMAKKAALSGKVRKWYVMTPVNYDYSRVCLNLKLSKKRYSDLLKKRYLWLINHKQKLELHVHLNMIMNISYNEQEKLITESVQWMKKELNLNVKEFVPGWWMSNGDTLKILKKLKLRLVKFVDYRYMHDYEWISRQNSV